MTDAHVNILLVDDQPSNLLALESILVDIEGVTLVKAESGRRALKQLLDGEFAVVLLDVQMPELDGFETAALIRTRERSRDTPIIFLTALSRSETNVFRGYELGAVDYIFKPFHPDVLRSKVNVFVELFRKRRELERQTQELARVNRQNQLILDAAAEGIFGIGLHAETTFVNPAAARMIGRRPDEIVRSNMHALVHPTFPGVVTCSEESCALYATLHGRLTQEHAEDTFFRADGTSFPVEYLASPMRDEESNLWGAVITFRDLTEKRAAAAADEAERRYREAEAQNRAKDNFLATLSHELRTPMTSILGWVQFLRSGEFAEDELAEALQTIESSARLQAHLIDDMLDVSRIILGKFQVDLRPVRLADVVEAALTTARPAASEADVRLTSEIVDRETVTAADPSRMQQVIGNLLSNAIKFTPPGRHVDLRLQRSNGSVTISVSDEGEGIEPSFLPHVFDRLRQADESAKRSGLGLGLAIAQHIVDLHHGEITAESEGLGRGARFVVRLPILSSELEAARERSVTPALLTELGGAADRHGTRS
ncbi:MAG: ATP-binding protein [Thermoanaerobaculia bacterium]